MYFSFLRGISAALDEILDHVAGELSLDFNAIAFAESLHSALCTREPPRRPLQRPGWTGSAIRTSISADATAPIRGSPDKVV